MERVGFRMRLKSGHEATYRHRHATIWPEMVAALKAAGCHNYSIFLRGADLFGYFEVDDFDRFCSSMDNSPVNSRWQADMEDLVNPLIDQATGFHRRLEEVFHLD